ncbi:YciI family protein [Pendulispora rubella]|uniref:YciI family protein n=1 Tax=Pendulispora rubella TaxID=2741070 RepID=A0ABZ2KW51_9BACT
MFVIELIYKAPLEKVDAVMKEHMVFIRKHYASGHFLVSGRQVPRTGGIILAVADDRAELEAIMQQDPFCAHGLAEFRIIEFLPNQRAKNIEELIR